MKHPMQVVHYQNSGKLTLTLGKTLSKKDGIVMELPREKDARGDKRGTILLCRIAKALAYIVHERMKKKQLKIKCNSEKESSLSIKCRFREKL
ncbi:hypothetical protein Trydic_g7999 [Trypoxylus dichotomus]